jgi:hypothetical protein
MDPGRDGERIHGIGGEVLIKQLTERTKRSRPGRSFTSCASVRRSARR